MTISAKLKAMCGRLIRGVPPGHPGAVGAVDSSPVDSQFIAESDLPDDPDVLIEAGVITPWRVDGDGERWYRVPASVIATDDDFDDDDGLPPEDPYDGLPPADDDFGDDRDNPYQWSGSEHDPY